ncbi:I78 family peptidase inhibitor [Devosia sp. LjRoot16]
MSPRLVPSVGLVAILVLSGCASTSRPPVHSLPVADCGASEVKTLIGQPVTGKSASDVRIGNNPVRSKGDVRVIAPGQAVIQNYSEGRLNLETDTSGRLLRATCG